MKKLPRAPLLGNPPWQVMTPSDYVKTYIRNTFRYKDVDYAWEKDENDVLTITKVGGEIIFVGPQHERLVWYVDAHEQLFKGVWSEDFKTAYWKDNVPARRYAGTYYQHLHDDVVLTAEILPERRSNSSEKYSSVSNVIRFQINYAESSPLAALTYTLYSPGDHFVGVALQQWFDYTEKLVSKPSPIQLGFPDDIPYRANEVLDLLVWGWYRTFDFAWDSTRKRVVICVRPESFTQWRDGINTFVRRDSADYTVWMARLDRMEQDENLWLIGFF